MRIAIISDIHGNSVALESVLRDLGKEHIDRVVCLGDVVSDGPQPREVVAHLKALGCSVVQGNMDAWLNDPHPFGGKSKNAQRGDEIRSWNVDQLSSDDLHYLSSFQATLEVSLDGTGELLCYHGSPRSCEEAIRSTTPDDELEKMLSGYSARVFAGGHTHTQMVRCFGERTIFNPGSVGAPSSLTGQNPESTRADYGVVSSDDSFLRIELRRVAVDVNSVTQAACSSGMPHVDWWIQNRYGIG